MDGGALPTLIVSTFAWSLYGIVALGGRWMPFGGDGPWLGLSEERMNTAYNLLDIVSKNVMGLIISALVLNDSYNKECIHPPSAPPPSAP